MRKRTGFSLSRQQWLNLAVRQIYSNADIFIVKSLRGFFGFECYVLIILIEWRPCVGGCWFFFWLVFWHALHLWKKRTHLWTKANPAARNKRKKGHRRNCPAKIQMGSSSIANISTLLHSNEASTHTADKPRDCCLPTRTRGKHTSARRLEKVCPWPSTGGGAVDGSTRYDLWTRTEAWNWPITQILKISEQTTAQREKCWWQHAWPCTTFWHALCVSPLRIQVEWSSPLEGVWARLGRGVSSELVSVSVLRRLAMMSTRFFHDTLRRFRLDPTSWICCQPWCGGDGGRGREGKSQRWRICFA